jgi:ribulose-5-phosphate 4-epimerase/fuculose-1-phosphate aldolase
MELTEAEARDTLAAAHRIAVYDGLAEGTWNHISYVLDDGRMLITPAEMHWSRVDADAIVIPRDDKDARGRGTQFYIGYRIHRPLHEARPDARCAVHVHPPFATALSVLDEERLLAMSQTSVSFYDRVAYNNKFDLLGGASEQGERIAEALGDKSALFLRGHGIVVTGPTIEEAYLDTYRLELACRTQLLAMSTGRPLRLFTDAEADELASSGPDHAEARRHFAAMREVVETQPAYQDLVG